MSTEGKKANFIVVDDSALDCFIAEKLIKHAEISNDVRSFTQATEALSYIKQNPSRSEPTIILLDILMPIMSGVEFVEEFENSISEDIQQNYLIAAFTSSMNKKDMSRMKSYKSVKYIFDKPLSAEVLIPLLEEVQ